MNPSAMGLHCARSERGSQLSQPACCPTAYTRRVRRREPHSPGHLITPGNASTVLPHSLRNGFTALTAVRSRWWSSSEVAGAEGAEGGAGTIETAAGVADLADLAEANQLPGEHLLQQVRARLPDKLGDWTSQCEREQGTARHSALDLAQAGEEGPLSRQQAGSSTLRARAGAGAPSSACPSSSSPMQRSAAGRTGRWALR